MATEQEHIDLSVQLGRLHLPNPILVASGTFGYAREMEKIVPLDQLGGIVPKTITVEARIGNDPWRTVETSCGLLNSIGLDNDGLAAFIAHHLPYLAELAAPLIVSIAGRTEEEFISMAQQLADAGGVDALELNISCPNVSGGVDFGTDPLRCAAVVGGVRAACQLPVLAKLTPNVTDITLIARAAAEAGADGLCLINTLLGMAVDWRARRPMLGNDMGGLSGPAIKPLALCAVWKVAQAVEIPIIGIGGIACLDDVMQFLVAGATAVQIGTASFYDPGLANRLVDQLEACLVELELDSVTDIVGTLDSTPLATTGH